MVLKILTHHYNLKLQHARTQHLIADGCMNRWMAGWFSG